MSRTVALCYLAPMVLTARLALPCLTLTALLAACGDDKSTPDAATDATVTDTSGPDAADTAVDDATSADTAVDDATSADVTDATSADVTDATSADVTDEDVPTTVDDLGFAIRVPQVRSVPSEDFEGNPTTQNATDIDHVCKVVADGLDAYLYVRANAESCRGWGGCQYTVPAAWLKVGDTISPVDGVGYDYGGNHHNDSISLPHGEHSLKLYHSSFGFGWRSCHAPDCAQIYAGDTLTTDGCTTDRTVPVICVTIGDDGTEPPLVDDFQKCLGDPNTR